MLIKQDNVGLYSVHYNINISATTCNSAIEQDTKGFKGDDLPNDKTAVCFKLKDFPRSYKDSSGFGKLDYVKDKFVSNDGCSANKAIYGYGNSIVFDHLLAVDTNFTIRYPSIRSIPRCCKYTALIYDYGNQRIFDCPLDARTNGHGPFKMWVLGYWKYGNLTKNWFCQFCGRQADRDTRSIIPERYYNYLNNSNDPKICNCYWDYRLFTSRKKVRNIFIERSWTPPYWPNKYGGNCAVCDKFVHAGEGFYDAEFRLLKLKKNGLGFYKQDIEGRKGGKCYCQLCFNKKFPWSLLLNENSNCISLKDKPLNNKLCQEFAEFNGKEYAINFLSNDKNVVKKRIDTRLERSFGSDLSEIKKDKKLLSVATDLANNKNLAFRYKLAGEKEKANKLLNCGTQFVNLICDDCGKKVAKQNFMCGDRLCNNCSKKRQQKAIKKAAEIIDLYNINPDNLCMLTLTVKNTSVISKKIWKELNIKFNYFLGWVEAVAGKEAIKGGFRASEVTNKGNDYHVHIHSMIWQGFPLSQLALSNLWLLATAGAGYVCDIRRIYNSESKNNKIKAGLYEIVKSADGSIKASQNIILENKESYKCASSYITKVMEINDPNTLMEIVNSLKSVRTVEFFGAFRKKPESKDINLDEDNFSDDKKIKNPCPDCGSEMVCRNTCNLRMDLKTAAKYLKDSREYLRNKNNR